MTQESDTFLEILKLAPPARLAKLQALPADLRQNIERRLALLEQATVDSVPNAVNSLSAVSQTAASSADERIGRYQLLELLGEGGMGQVYLAQQDQPKRQVALKLLSGRQSAESLLRFQAEAEFLGRLQHPNIAKIYESGHAQTKTGDTPFLAMEYVKGLELTSYCARQQLGDRAKLKLIAEIAQAVQHAHLRGVVHRDLKPANILVDEQGAVKILDFGIARSLERNDPQAQMTREGQVIGTLAYMSPEQILGDQRQVDLRTDVYALGVIAYELLCGQLPLEITQVSMLDAIRQVESKAPLALARHRKALAGDINTIVMKALNKQPDARYASAGEFADDIQRYLQAEPIRARPATIRYLTQQFVKRNRYVVAASGVVMAALVGASIVSWRSAETAKAALLKAEQRAAEVSAVNEFVENMLLSADPERADGQKLTMVEFLDGAKLSLVNLQKSPDAQAKVASLMGQVYGKLGQPDTARSLFADAKAAKLRAGSSDDEMGSELQIFDLIELTRAGKAAAAAELFPALCQRINTRYTLQHRLSYDCANAYSQAHQELGNSEKVIEIVDAALKQSSAALLHDPEKRDELKFNLAFAYVELGEGERSEAVLREVLASELTRNGANSAPVLSTKKALGQALHRRAKLPEAVALYQEVYDGRKRLYGPSHNSTMVAAMQLGAGLTSLKRFDEALPVLNDVINTLQPIDPSNGTLLGAMVVRGGIYRSQGDLPRALESYRAVVAMESKLGGPVPDTVMARGALAMTLTLMQQLPQAEKAFGETIPMAREVLGASHIYNAQLASAAAENALQMGQFDRARALLEPALKLMLETAPEHPRTAEAQARLERALAGGN
jgi:eukaryotic-like serine/threonine-protein kinase